ncbi:hypothetical protein COHA_008566 [Chlorella ohadii]|uniref:Uncharacterized protein n=1 Tax=Chlorella ohadii TaxID=2649997 RepID=A0AAD5DNM9_9CHLO|nr:hypothetical protein COHA_008566 [Chlorella ohadii]
MCSLQVLAVAQPPRPRTVGAQPSHRRAVAAQPSVQGPGGRRKVIARADPSQAPDVMGPLWSILTAAFGGALNEEYKRFQRGQVAALEEQARAETERADCEEERRRVLEGDNAALEGENAALKAELAALKAELAALKEAQSSKD